MSCNVFGSSNVAEFSPESPRKSLASSLNRLCGPSATAASNASEISLRVVCTASMEFVLCISAPMSSIRYVLRAIGGNAAHSDSTCTSMPRTESMTFNSSLNATANIS